MASGSEMEVVLVAQVSSLVKGMQEGAAATQQLLNTIKQMSGGMDLVGKATKPANDAVKSFGDTIKSYKAEQAGQARTVNFFVRELSETIGISREASGAVSGLGQVFIEAATGGSAFAIGFEAVKFVIGGIVQTFKAAEERAKDLAASVSIATSALTSGAEALQKFTNTQPTEGAKAFAEVFAAATKESLKLSESIEKLRPTKWSQIAAFIWDGALGIKRVNDEFAQASASLGKMVEDAKMFAEAAGDLSGGYEESPAQDKRYWQIKADDFKTDQEALKVRRKLISDSFDKIISDVAEKNAKLLEALSKPAANESYDAARQFREVREPALQMRAEYAMKQPVIDTDFFAKGQVKALEPLKAMNAEMQTMLQVGSILGDTVGSAFYTIGASIGGTAGKFVSSVGEMISQAIKFAIAMVTASAAQTPVVGWLMAAGAGVSLLASLVGTLSSVPSYDVGTLSVPRTGLAMVHQGEAILPADGTAQAYRSGGRNVTVNLNVTAMDGASVYRVITDNRGQVARAFREMARDGAG